MPETAPTLPTPAPSAAITEACAAGEDEPFAAIDSVVVTGWVEQLARFERDVTDAERIDQLRALEQLKAAAAAAQARITVDLDASVRAAHAAAGIPADRQGRGVAAQVALARQESPYKGGRHPGLAKVLDPPGTATAAPHQPRPDTHDQNDAARQGDGTAALAIGQNGACFDDRRADRAPVPRSPLVRASR